VVDSPKAENDVPVEENSISSNDKFKDWNVETLNDEVSTDENQIEEVSNNESNTYKES